MLKSTLLIFLTCIVARIGVTAPLTLSNATSPDKKYELIITHSQDKATLELMPQMVLRNVKTGKAIASLSLEIDESDDRKSIAALWSPNSRYVAVNHHLGQLYSFTIYDIKDGKLHPLPELPTPKKLQKKYFTPESTKSRGGQQVQRWLDSTTFLVADTMYYVDITYHIAKRKFEMVDVKYEKQ